MLSELSTFPLTEIVRVARVKHRFHNFGYRPSAKVISHAETEFFNMFHNKHNSSRHKIMQMFEILLLLR